MMELSKEYLAMKAAARKRAAIENTDPLAIECRTQQLLDVAANAIAIPSKRTIKSVTIEAEFGELKGGRTYQVGRGKGSNFKAAAAAAMRDLLKQKGLKAQRFTTCKAVISFGTITEG
jgi:dsRNA-specific ribonuclease